MKINSISAINFKRAYTTEEKKEALKLQKEAMELIGNKKVILIIPETSLPVSKTGNIGAGQLNSKISYDFFEFAKTYMGINRIKVLPQGEMKIRENNFYCNYSSSGLTLGSNLINLEELTEDKMGKILSKETLQKVYNNAEKTGEKGIVNFENVIGINSEHHNALKEAFENFIKNDSTEIKTLKQNFERYKLENKEVLENKALYDSLVNEYKSANYTKWTNEIDRELFNPDKVSKEIKEKRILEIKTNYANEIEFSKFKQFLADMNLNKAKSKLNQNGDKLMGDCLIGFSYEDIWAYPKAFENANVCSKDWELRSLNFAEITQEGSESNKLLKLKVKQFAKRYDEIRFDVGWGYINPVLYPLNNSALNENYYYDSAVEGFRVKNYLGDNVIKIIEDTVKSVKGKDYNLDNLIYEIEAGKEFTAFDWNNNKIIDALKGRTIVQSSCYMSNNYGTIDFMEKTMKIPRKNYVYMSGNHDHIALDCLSRKFDIDNMLRNNGDDINTVVENQIKPLADALKIEESIIRDNPSEFKKAKFSYSFLAENIKLFFMDVFGRCEQFDSQEKNTKINYRYMIDSDYEKKFLEALEKEKGFNIMESLAGAMKAKGLDKTHSDVYNNLLKFSNILKEKTPAPARGGGEKIIPSPKNGGKIALCCTGIAAGIIGILYYFYGVKTDPNKKLSA